MLLHKCLTRVPEPGDVSIGAQLARLFHEHNPQQQSQQLQKQQHQVEHDVVGSPATVGDSNGEGEKGRAGASVDVTAGGLLPPPPGRLQKLLLRTKDVLQALWGGPPASTSPAAPQDSHISAERIMSEIGGWRSGRQRAAACAPAPAALE